MVSCSKRRKTKSPFCKDDPNCVWNNRSCKKKPSTNNHTRVRNKTNNGQREHSQEKSNAKLNMIIHKLNHIESMLHKMTLKNKKTKTKKRSMTISNKSNNLSLSAETASPTNVAKLLSNQSNNLSAETVSPSAANRLETS